MGPFSHLLEALDEKAHVLTVASRGGDRSLADRTLRDARAIQEELFTRRSPRRAHARKD